MRRARHTALLLPLLAPLLLAATPALAQSPSDAPTTAGTITLNFPDNVPLKVLVDYVAARLGWNVLYDDTAVSQRITLRVATKLRDTDLPGLLDTVLRSKGLSLIDAGNGFKRVVPLAGAVAANPQPGAAAGGVVTEVFRLNSAEPASVDTVVKPMLTTPGGSSLALPDSRLLVVTDTAATVARIADLLRRIDVPSRDVTIKLIPVAHAEVGALSKQLSTLLNAQLRATRGQAAPTEGADTSSGLIDVSYDARTNQILLVAPGDLAALAVAIVRQLDVPVTDSQSPVRFYKLANATAVDVLATIQSLGGGSPPPASDNHSSLSTPGVTAVPDRLSANNAPAVTSSATPSATPTAPTPEPTATPRRSEAARALDSAPANVREAIRGKPAQVTADPNTNTIIVIAEPAVQQLYEQLIRAMDKRRPQVLIEATIVTVDTSDNFELGVELGSAFGTDHAITFSSFGLSVPDATTGQLAIAPGTGFNGTLINSKVASAVIRALAQSSRARVQSAPRILVNDNASGQLQSVAEQPFTSVNASNTVSTTSFAGYAEAGTQITVTPHISEADYLQLDYDVTLSSFTSPGTVNGVPPSRQRDAVNSRVTIPDGTTIIVGGLNRRNFLRTKDSVPLLGDIPVLEYLFSHNIIQNRETTLFVFIRPVILRDDQFEDLKFISERETRTAEIKGDFPESEPMTLDSGREKVPAPSLADEPTVGPPRHMTGDMRPAK